MCHKIFTNSLFALASDFCRKIGHMIGALEKKS